MPDVFVVGLDLGGTRIKARLLDDAGTIYERLDLPTQADRGPVHVIRGLADAAAQVCDRADVDVSTIAGIGVGSPGPLDAVTGVVTRSVNLPNWHDVPLRDELSRRTGRPVSVLNDANAACFGEFWVGAGRGVQDLVMFTVGTGLGGGVISQGSLLTGRFGQAGELGHIIVEPGGPRCGCGQHGCLEVFAAESHMIRRAVREGIWPDAAEHGVRNLLDAADAGEECAERIWKDCCEALATVAVSLQHVLNPALILLGGGVSGAGDRLLKPVREARDRLVWSMADDAPNIRLATLGNDAGAIGAAGWFLRSRSQT